MVRDPSFEVAVTSEIEPGKKLLVGIADFGVAGLTAADYLVSHVESDQIGHIETRNLPDIAPFSNGIPRYPIRLYSGKESDITVLISEVFLPVGVTDQLADTLLEWISSHNIEETTILYGAPFPHGEEEHIVFHVGTDEYRERHFIDSQIQPLSGGFFDGVIGELMIRGLRDDVPPTGVLITPAHLPGPDFDAALRLLDALESVYGIAVNEDELEKRSEEMKRYYEELAQRLQMFREGDRSLGSRDYPEDRMYM